MIMRIVMMTNVPFLIPLVNWGVGEFSNNVLKLKIQKYVTTSNNPVKKLKMPISILIMVIQQISTKTNFQHSGIMPDSVTNFPQN